MFLSTRPIVGHLYPQRSGDGYAAQENKKLKKSNAQLNQSLADATKQSSLKKLEDAKLRRDYEAAVTLLDRIPPEIVNAYARMPAGRREKTNER